SSPAGPGIQAGATTFELDPAVQVHGSPIGTFPTFVRRAALDASGAAPGQSIPVTIYSPDGDLVILLVSWPDYPFPLPPFGTLWLDPTGIFYVAGGYQDQTEHWQPSVSVPSFAPRGLAVALQGLSGPGLDIRLGNPAVVVLH